MADAHPNPPMRVFCPKHDEFYATYTIGRPVLDDRCPACLIESLQSRERRLREALEKCAEPHRWHAPCIHCGPSIIEQGCYVARAALSEDRA